MHKYIILVIYIIFIKSSATLYEYAIIGAGPAGITATGILADMNQNAPETIIWIDPLFNGGRIEHFSTVPSNTTVALFMRFLTSCKSFKFDETNNALIGIAPDKGITLDHINHELIRITQQLQSQVRWRQALARKLERIENVWHITLDSGEVIRARTTILTTGSHPKQLKHDHPTIPLETAFNCKELQKHVKQDQTICVYGSSHSAILVMRNLHALGIRHFINVYKNNLVYAQYENGWIKYDNTGLKLIAAEWAREHLSHQHPHITRMHIDDEHLSKLIKQCDVYIDAIGYERNKLPPIIIDSKPLIDIRHNPQTGYITEGLYGFGIAFPERVTHPDGNQEWNVGMWKFMRYMTNLFPRLFPKNTLRTYP